MASYIKKFEFDLNSRNKKAIRDLVGKKDWYKEKEKQKQKN